MNTLRTAPYLLCPHCKGRVRADANTLNGVVKCPVCKEAGLLAMHHSDMGGFAKGLAKWLVVAVLAIAVRMVFPDLGMKHIARITGSGGSQSHVADAADGNSSVSAQAGKAVDPVTAGEPLSSSLVRDSAGDGLDFHAVARLHRMVGISAARMEELRKDYVAAIGKSTPGGIFDPATMKNGAIAGSQAMEEAASLAAAYQAECEQVARDLRVAINEASVSEAARECGLGFLRTMVLHEQSLWNEVMQAFKDGRHALPATTRAMQANSGKGNRSGGIPDLAGKAGKAAARAALVQRWSNIRDDLLKPAAMPPMPDPKGIVAQQPVRLRGNK